MERPNREQALALLHEHVKTDNLRRHALAVEAAMRHLARKWGADEEEWGVVGLVHDVDYERYPDEHCRRAPELLAAAGWPESYVRAVVSHGWGLCSDVEPLTDLERCLYAVDELTGLVAAAALVRPSRSVLDLTAKSVKKKWKDKAFAAGVDRGVIEKGASLLGVDVGDLITDTIEGMRTAAAELGLEGTPGAAE